MVLPCSENITLQEDLTSGLCRPTPQIATPATPRPDPPQKESSLAPPLHLSIFLSCPALKQKLLPKAPLLNTKIYQDLKNHSQSTASTTGHF